MIILAYSSLDLDGEGKVEYVMSFIKKNQYGIQRYLHSDDKVEVNGKLIAKLLQHTKFFAFVQVVHKGACHLYSAK